MSKILIVYPQLNHPLTGGQVYDFNFIKQAEKCEGKSFIYLLDEDVKGTNNIHFICKYLIRWKKFCECDHIITNSRLYPRLLVPFILFRLFHKNFSIILIHHHFNFLTHTGIKKRIHRWFEINFLKQAKRVIIPSPYMLKQMEVYCPRIQIKYLQIAFKSELGSGEEKKINNELLFVGNIEPRKGIINLIKMADFLYHQKVSFHLTLAGNIVDREYFQLLQREIRTHDLSEYIQFVGRVNNEQLKKLFQKASVFVFPSLHEGYGMVLVEAMAYQLPVVAFNNSAMPYTVKDYVNGFLVSDRDVESFSQKVFQLISSPNLWKSLSKGAYNTFLNSRHQKDLDREIRAFIVGLENL